MKRGYEKGLVCSQCPSPVTNQSRSGLCKPCFMAKLNSDPTTAQNRVVGIKKAFERPDIRAKLRAASRANAAKRMADPALREIAVRNMREVIQPRSCTPEAVARRDNVTRGRRQTETKLGWCPPDYRALYIKLMRSNGVRKDIAREMVLEQARLDIARLSPFERQERALANGARLIANDCGPMFGEALNVVGG